MPLADSLLASASTLRPPELPLPRMQTVPQRRPAMNSFSIRRALSSTSVADRSPITVFAPKRSRLVPAEVRPEDEK